MSKVKTDFLEQFSASFLIFNKFAILWLLHTSSLRILFFSYWFNISSRKVLVKNFDNRSIFVENMDKSFRMLLGHPVCLSMRLFSYVCMSVEAWTKRRGGCGPTFHTPNWILLGPTSKERDGSWKRRKRKKGRGKERKKREGRDESGKGREGEGRRAPQLTFLAMRMYVLSVCLQYSCMVVKYDRRGYRPRRRPFILTTEAVYILNEKDFRLKLKIPFSNLTS